MAGRPFLKPNGGIETNQGEIAGARYDASRMDKYLARYVTETPCEHRVNDLMVGLAGRTPVGRRQIRANSRQDPGEAENKSKDLPGDSV